MNEILYNAILNVQEQIYTKKMLRTDAHIYAEQGEVAIAPEFSNEFFLRIPIHMLILGVNIE